MQLKDVLPWAEGHEKGLGTVIFWLALAGVTALLYRLFCGESAAPSKPVISYARAPQGASATQQRRKMTRNELALYDGNHEQEVGETYYICAKSTWRVSLPCPRACLHRLTCCAACCVPEARRHNLRRDVGEELLWQRRAVPRIHGQGRFAWSGKGLHHGRGGRHIQSVAFRARDAKLLVRQVRLQVPHCW